MNGSNHNIISFFNKLSENANIKAMLWYLNADKTILQGDVDEIIQQKNAPKTYQDIILSLGKKIYEKFEMNHPLIAIPNAQGKHYDIKKNKDGTYSFIIAIDTLKAQVASIKKRQSNEITSNSLTFEELEYAKKYLNGPNKLGHNIENLTEDSYVLSIIPIKNDPDNCDIKIKSHFVRLGRSNAIEANITSTIVSTKRIKKFAAAQKKIDES